MDLCFIMGKMWYSTNNSKIFPANTSTGFANSVQVLKHHNFKTPNQCYQDCSLFLLTFTWCILDSGFYRFLSYGVSNCLTFPLLAFTWVPCAYTFIAKSLRCPSSLSHAGWLWKPLQKLSGRQGVYVHVSMVSLALIAPVNAEFDEGHCVLWYVLPPTGSLLALDFTRPLRSHSCHCPVPHCHLTVMEQLPHLTFWLVSFQALGFNIPFDILPAHFPPAPLSWIVTLICVPLSVPTWTACPLLLPPPLSPFQSLPFQITLDLLRALF